MKIQMTITNEGWADGVKAGTITLTDGTTTVRIDDVELSVWKRASQKNLREWFAEAISFAQNGDEGYNIL